jgi:hypothetical protein
MTVSFCDVLGNTRTSEQSTHGYPFTLVQHARRMDHWLSSVASQTRMLIAWALYLVPINWTLDLVLNSCTAAAGTSLTGRLASRFREGATEPQI